MRTGSLLVVAAVSTAVVTGCGGSSADDVPTNGVAKVGDTVITKKAFERRLSLAQSSEAGEGGEPVKLQPPEFTACVAAKRRTSQGPEGGEKTDDSELRTKCQEEYEAKRAEVMEFLVQNVWVTKEVRARNLSVTEKDVQKAFDEQKSQQFPTEKAFRKFLADQGRTEEDILEIVRTQLMQQALSEKIVAGKLTPSDAEIQRYYDKNKKQLGKPERRTLRLVLTKDEATADQAKQALADGEDWKAVAKRYSRDKGTAAKGGLLPEIEKTGDDDLDSAMEKASLGTVTGPVKTQFGWVVFEVEKVIPAEVPPLDDARTEVVAAVKEEKRQKTLDAFAREFREKYRTQTVCADDYAVVSCSNGPEKNPTVTQSSMQPGANSGQDE